VIDENIGLPWGAIALIALYLAGLLILAEMLNRFTVHSGEVTRKIVHIGSGHVVLFAWWLNIPRWVGIAAAIAAGLIALLSYFLPILPSLESVGRKSFGTFFYAVSIGILIGYFFPNYPEFATLGILTMAWGDGLAALVGKRWGKHPYQYWGNRKSWEGSCTMLGLSFTVGIVILGTVYGLSWMLFFDMAGVAILATLLEVFAWEGIDNLTVPLGSAFAAFVCYLLTQFS
jgi:phytol kinase